jgi:hypothetical protein
MLHVLLGIAAYVPGLNHRIVNRGTGGTDKAEYCYGVWMKHLTMLWCHGMTRMPDTVAELGPGDSIGVGIAALLSGANHYYALDTKQYATAKRNFTILEELVELFAQRAGRPGRGTGWPNFNHLLDSNLFPSQILTDERLNETLRPERIASIRSALTSGVSADGAITVAYIAPWEGQRDVAPDSIDMLYSHSVMEHVVDLRSAYGACAAWVRPGGFMSHQIDFKSHRLARKWNGCWAYASDPYWRLIAGRRDCKINRQPCSSHVGHIQENGFEILCHLKSVRHDGIKRSQLAPRWRDLSDDDLTCAEAFIQARRG